MSAIGTYEVLNRRHFERCLEAARNIRTETTGKWLFKSTTTIGVPEFMQAWQTAVQKKVVFDYSGYVLGNYLDAQLTLNQSVLADEQSEVARILAKVFTAAFVFERA